MLKLTPFIISSLLFWTPASFAAAKVNSWCAKTMRELQNASSPLFSQTALEERAQDKAAEAAIETLFPLMKRSARDRQRGYADPNFPPEIKRVSKEEIENAVGRIKADVLAASPFDELTVLDSVAYHTRKYLFAKLGGKRPFPLSPDLIRGLCFESTRFVRGQLAELQDTLDLKIAFHDLKAFTGEYWPHYVAVVQFKSGRIYWLDFTWAQFDGSSNEQSLVGKTLRSSGELGTLMANLLNAKGILPLNDRVTALLLHAFQSASPQSAKATLRTLPPRQHVMKTEELLLDTADMSRF